MVTPQLSTLCHACRTIAADHLDEALELSRPLHQVDPALLSWFHAGDHLATLRHQYRSEHLYGAVEVLEGTLLRALPEPFDSKESRDQMAELTLIREGWKP
jgi:hypothetical protein